MYMYELCTYCLSYLGSLVCDLRCELSGGRDDEGGDHVVLQLRERDI